MKIARVSTRAGVIWIGLFVSSMAMARLGHAEGEIQAPGNPALEPVAEDAGPLSSSTQFDESDLLGVHEIMPPGGWVEGCSSELCGGQCGVCAYGPCCAVCGGGSCYVPSWYTHQDVRFWARSRPRRRALSREFEIQQFLGLDPNGEATWRQNLRVTREQMHTGTVNFEPAPGWNMILGHHLGRTAANRDLFFEFQYSGLLTWQEGLELNGTRQPVYASDEAYPPDQPPAVTGYTGSLLSPYREFDPADLGNGFATPAELLLSDVFNKADRHQQEQISDFHSFEANLWIRPRGRGDRLVLHPNGKWQRECTPGEYLSYLLGLRVITVDEKFRFDSHATRYNPSFQTIGLGEGEYRIQTHNDLLGLQLGLDWLVRRCKWTYGLRAKMGPMLNFTDQQSRVFATFSDFTGEAPLVRDVHLASKGRKNSAALLGEFGLLGSYKLTPRLTLEASYDFMWLVGLALAPEQIHFSAETLPVEVNDNGHVYYHGLTFGAQFAY